MCRRGLCSQGGYGRVKTLSESLFCNLHYITHFFSPNIHLSIHPFRKPPPATTMTNPICSQAFYTASSAAESSQNMFIPPNPSRLITQASTGTQSRQKHELSVSASRTSSSNNTTFSPKSAQISLVSLLTDAQPVCLLGCRGTSPFDPFQRTHCCCDVTAVNSMCMCLCSYL